MAPSYVLFSCFIKPRHRMIWDQCYSDLDPSIPLVSIYEIATPSQITTPSPALSPVSYTPTSHDASSSVSSNLGSNVPVLILNTAFDPTLEVNRKVMFGGNKGKSSLTVTKTQRKLAHKAEEALSYEDFSEKVLISFSFIICHFIICALIKPALSVPLNRK